MIPPLLSEIREQGVVLARVHGDLELYRSWAHEGREARWWFVGCGDMAFAGALTRDLARMAGGNESARGPTFEAATSMDLRWWTPSPSDHVVCASISGRTQRTVEAARLARKAGARVYGITDNEGSPLCAEVDATAILRTSPPETLTRDAYAGYQNIIPQTKTFLAAWFAELSLVDSLLGGGFLDDVVAYVETTIRSLEEAFAESEARIAEAFQGSENVAVLGSGPHRAMAKYGAAKMTEYAIPSWSQCLEEYNHLELFVAGPKTTIVALGTDAPSHQRVGELAASWEALGARVLRIGPEMASETVPIRVPAVGRVPGADWATFFGEAIALQILSYHAARALGRDPNRWLGGVRTDLIQNLSQTTIRGSAIRESES